MRVLLTGKNGQLGRCFRDIALLTKDVELFSFDSVELNITNLTSVQSVCKRFNPDIMVNAAAYTLVDKAEEDSENANLINITGTKNLAITADMFNIPLIHISTDYVFDGSATVPYRPSDKTCPQNIYGQSKLAGEYEMKALLRKYIILRTSWVFSEYGNNFVKSMIHLSKTKSKLKIIDDQFGSPTYARDLATAIMSLCIQYKKKGKLIWGTYHYSGDIPTNWYEFACVILKKSKEKGIIDTIPHLYAISSQEYKTIANRPNYSVLDNSDLQYIGLNSSNWTSSLSLMLDRLLINSKNM
tara:strand:- start:15181 stop:16077 length:897 start_codon:yes stop_codon:yes gene_type:complete